MGFALLLVFGLSPDAGAAPAQTLNGKHVPAAVARLAPVGSLPGSQRLDLAIGLPLRNQEELDRLLQELCDPTSPNYRRYLTLEQFTARFGPTEKDYQALMDFAKSNGLTVTVTHPNRVVLDVSGTVTAIARTFHLNLRVYPHPREARTFYAPDVEPSVDFAVPILHISGLDNYSLPHPNSRLRPVTAAANTTPNSGTGPSGTYRGSDFRTAYVPGTSMTGTGQSVGLLQFDGFYASDIATYVSQAGLPTIPVTVVPVDGGVSTPGTGNSEVCLDIEMVMSMAPGVSGIYVYEAPNPSPWVDLLSRMANDTNSLGKPLCNQLSCSWGGGGVDASAEQIFKQMGVQGQSFFNATGDSDAFTGAIGFPSDSTNITEVGGTTLTTGTGATYTSETVWNWGLHSGSYVGSSGGISTYYAIPSYQQGISMSANQGSTTQRNVPDVALTADNVYVTYNNGSTGTFGGTSCAAPLWAGFTALVNQQAAAAGLSPVGFLNPVLYTIGKGASYAAAFHDTTTGNNYSSNSPTEFSAVTGYDLCTGWGTPNGTNLINALTAPPILAPIIASNSFVLVSEGCPNGVVDPAETVTVNFGLQNIGTASTTNLVATLLSTDGILSPSGPQTYGVLGAKGTAVVQPFTFTAAGSCGGTNTASLQLQDGAADLGTVTFSFRLGQGGISNVFSQSFDDVTAPALPAGWTTATSGSQSAWVTSTSTRDTTPNALFSTDPAKAGVNEVDSPAFTLPDGQAQLMFRNNYNLETSYDGGVLEIKIGS
ncbi:MAG TPA: protease pro-enzyme activation domain-containing protein, partial [Verrucomicrobiae bacterium]